jgi:hypothetical protein
MPHIAVIDNGRTTMAKQIKATPLAEALAVIGKEGTELEAKATQVLRIVRQSKIGDVKAFGAAVRDAYKANGWNGKPGKPKAEEKADPVPATVKQYVSQIRAAFRLKLPVASYTSFYALREDLRKHRARKAAKVAKAVEAQPKEMLGIRLVEPEQFNGGPFHDLAVLYNALDRTRKPKLLAALARIKREFAMSAPQLVVQSLPELPRTGTYN